MDDSVTHAPATTPGACSCSCGGSPGDELRVPFWVMVVGFGVGAFWTLAGVAVGRWTSRR